MLVVGDDGAIEVAIQVPVGVTAGVDGTVAVTVVTPAGHAYTSSWTLSLLDGSPDIGATAQTKLGSSGVIVAGRAPPYADVEVAGKAVVLDDQGRFSTSVDLPPWPTAVTVTARDPLGNEASLLVSGVGILDYRGLPWLPIALVSARWTRRRAVRAGPQATLVPPPDLRRRGPRGDRSGGRVLAAAASPRQPLGQRLARIRRGLRGRRRLDRSQAEPVVAWMPVAGAAGGADATAPAGATGSGTGSAPRSARRSLRAFAARSSARPGTASGSGRSMPTRRPTQLRARRKSARVSATRRTPTSSGTRTIARSRSHGQIGVGKAPAAMSWRQTSAAGLLRVERQPASAPGSGVGSERIGVDAETTELVRGRGDDAERAAGRIGPFRAVQRLCHAHEVRARHPPRGPCPRSGPARPARAPPASAPGRARRGA